MKPILGLFGRSQFNSGWRAAFVALALLSLAVSSANAQDVQLSAEQKQKMKAFAANTRSGTESQRDALKSAREELGAVYSSYKLDEARASKAIDRIGKAQQQLLGVHLSNQVKIRQILTKDQFNTFQQMMSKKMHGPGPERAFFREDEAFELGAIWRIKDSLKLTPDQEKRVAAVLRPGNNMKNMQDMKRATEQLNQLYSSFNLDAAAARKLIGDIHRDQLALTRNAHSRQQTIRSILTQDQFAALRQEIIKRMGERREHRRPSPEL
ncbi:MAG: periplasmic heavy metal sensor [Armatimonadetes bacterium]|nr:periplasmic heavy metal sensor [Armatimonadota bacterium]